VHLQLALAAPQAVVQTFPLMGLALVLVGCRS
jgi:hypothetical protein